MRPQYNPPGYGRTKRVRSLLGGRPGDCGQRFSRAQASWGWSLCRGSGSAAVVGSLECVNLCWEDCAKVVSSLQPGLWGHQGTLCSRHILSTCPPRPAPSPPVPLCSWLLLRRQSKTWQGEPRNRLIAMPLQRPLLTKINIMLASRRNAWEWNLLSKRR